MKKSVLFAILLCVSMLIAAQSIPGVECSQKGKIESIIYHVPDKTPNPFMNYDVDMVRNKGMIAPFEVELGETFYDLQTNGCLDNRFTIWDDGTMAAIWTRGLAATAFINRGTGYNYFDGSVWGPWPTGRIEDRRCGWPSHAAWGETGEIVVSHNGQEGLEWSQREVKGTGAWTQTNFLGPAGVEDDITWPRMITSGDNNEYIHLVVNSYSDYLGQPRALLYSRSDDGGDTWDPHNIVLDETGDDDYFEIDADGYTMAARGNTVCILVGSAWMDLFYMRSDDNGDTWEKHIVWEHPYPLFDPATMLADTFFCMDGAAQMTIDNQGHAHVVFALQRAIADEDDFGLYAWNPKYDGIAYWNDTMEPFSNDIDALSPPQLGYENTEMIEDVNYIGWMQDIDGDGVVTLEGIRNYHDPGMSSMPSITVDDQGIRYVIFTSNTETYVYYGITDTVNFKHIWTRSYSNSTWGEFTDLTEHDAHLFEECYFPVIGKATGGYLHYIFNVDYGPGTAFADQHEWHQNRIIYGMQDISTGVEENEVLADISFELNPNPAIDRVQIKVDLETGSHVHVSLTSITGQMVREVTRDKVNTGTVNIGIDVSDLSAGIYICTVKTDNAVATKKLIVR